MQALQQIRRKFYNRQELALATTQWRAEDERIVFTNGCFDLLHPGHIDYLAKAASLGTKLIIGLNTDASVSRLKGPHRPIQNEQARLMLLGALLFTDALCFFEEDTPLELISAIKPHILVKGSDYAIDGVVGAEFVMQNGGSVALLPYLEGYSTSGIERRILAGVGKV